MSARKSSWKERVEACLKRWGVVFHDLELLQQALTHPSYHSIEPTVPDNQRLEFLGDAVLDLVVGEWLYHSFPELSPRELTDYRAALVEQKRLAQWAQALGLAECIRLGRGSYQNQRQEVQTRILADTLEALIGALYLDQGYQVVWDFVLPWLQKDLRELRERGGVVNYKGRLQEWSQSQGLGQPEYRTIAKRGTPHEPCFEVEVRIRGKVYGRGTGRSQREAQKEAARDALMRLGLLNIHAPPARNPGARNSSSTPEERVADR